MDNNGLYLASFNEMAVTSTPSGKLTDVSISHEDKANYAEKQQSIELAHIYNKLQHVANGFVQYRIKDAYDGISSPNKSKTTQTIVESLLNQQIAASIPDINAASTDELEDIIMDHYDSVTFPLVNYGKDIFTNNAIPNYVAHAMFLMEYDLHIPDDETTTGTRKAQKLCKRAVRFLDKQCQNSDNTPDEVKLIAYGSIFNQLNEIVSNFDHILAMASNIDEDDGYQSIEDMLDDIAEMNNLPNTIEDKQVLERIGLKLNNIPRISKLEQTLHNLAAEADKLYAVLDERHISEKAEIIPFPAPEL